MGLRAATWSLVRSTWWPNGDARRRYGSKGVELADVDDETYKKKVGAELIKQAPKMNDVAGDGTTTVGADLSHLTGKPTNTAAGPQPYAAAKRPRNGYNGVITGLQAGGAIEGKSSAWWSGHHVAPPMSPLAI